MPQLLSNLFWNMPRGPLDKLRLVLLNLRYVTLITNNLSCLVSSCLRHTGQFCHGQHDLLLINDNAVGVLGEWLHQGVVILNHLLALVAGNVGGTSSRVHGTGTNQRVRRNEVVEVLDSTHLDKQVGVGRSLTLEHTPGPPLRQVLVNLLVIKWQCIEVN